MSNFSFISWLEQVTFNEMMMIMYDDQQFDQYQQNKQSALTKNNWT
jgi:hypothetical protein